jgi:hypothetical protein
VVAGAGVLPELLVGLEPRLVDEDLAFCGSVHLAAV